MMTTIRQIVTVNITRDTTPVTQVGFGIPLFLGLGKGFTERVRFYTSTTEVAVDFSTASNEYLAAQKAFGQDISVTTMAIGRQDSTTVTYTPTVANSTTYTVTINGTAFNFISDASATASEIVAGLISVINADVPLPVTASGTTTLILTGDAGVDFSTKATTNLVPVYATTESLTDALTAIQIEDDSWYGLAAYTHVKADVLEIAAWAQSASKLYGTSTSDTNTISQTLSADTTSVGKALKDAGYDRTWTEYSADPTVFPEMALFGSELARDVGKATWSFKTQTGVTVDNLTSTQSTNAQSKNVITYENVGGVNSTIRARVADGTPIDTIRNLDWLQARITETLYTAIRSGVRYDDDGISVIQGNVKAVLSNAIDKGVIARDPFPTVTVPKKSTISLTDVGNRFLPDVNFTATVLGFVESCDVQGVASL
jgi:hypothetical protein